MSLKGRVAIITGGGRGIGREHALLFGRLGAKIVINDLGGSADGSGGDPSPAHQVVQEISELGGEAVANTDSVSSWEGARVLVDTAIEAFGQLDILVNNAGILRDRTLVNMNEEEWDSVIDVHLKGHFCPLHWAAIYWRNQAKSGATNNAAIVNTSSAAGLYGNPGQVNYATAKAGIVAMTLVGARELERYGVRVNAISPAARTRLTEATPGMADHVKAPSDESKFDIWDPANISPLVAALSMSDCELSGRVFEVIGGNVTHDEGWRSAEKFSSKGRWDAQELAAAMAKDIPGGVPPLPDWM